MIEENKQRKNKVIRGIALLGLFLMVFGISYALFKVTLNGKKTNKITTGKMDLYLTDKNGTREDSLPEGTFAINLEGNNAVPMSAVDAIENLDSYEFNLVNGGTIDTYYNLYLEVDESISDLSPDNIKYYFTKGDDQDILSYNLPDGTGKDEEPIVNIKQNNYQNQTRLLSACETKTKDGKKLYRLDRGLIKPEETNKYNLRLWVSYQSNTEINDKTFETKLYIEGTQKPIDEAYPIFIHKLVNSKTRVLYEAIFSDDTYHVYGNGEFKIDYLINTSTADGDTSYNLINIPNDLSEINKILKKYNIEEITTIEEAANLWAEDGYDWDQFTDEDYDALLNCYNEGREIYIDDGITKISSLYSGYLSKYIKKIFIADSVTSISNNAAKSLTNLEEVTFMTSNKYENKNTSIGTEAFSSGTLKKVTFNNNIFSFAYNAFANNTNLTEITIPKLNNIKYNSFQGCTNLNIKILQQNNGNIAYCPTNNCAFDIEYNKVFTTETFGAKSVTWVNG